MKVTKDIEESFRIGLSLTRGSMITFNLGIQIGGSYEKGMWKLTTTSLMQEKETLS